MSPEFKVRQGAYLPHWTREGATYAVRFRLADSVAKTVVESWKFDRKDIPQTAARLGRPTSQHEKERLDGLFSESVEKYLDQGSGKCWLREDRFAGIVADALTFFDGLRYHLFAWCVMPNHVHAVLEPINGHELPDILQSWKSFRSKEINRILGSRGKLWEAEYYDHLIRNEKDFNAQVEYVLTNPVRAGLKNWKWFGLARQVEVARSSRP